MAVAAARLGHLCTAACALGEVLAVATPDNKVVLYKWPRMQRITELEGHEDTVTCLQLTAASTAAAAAEGNSTSSTLPLRLISSSHDRNSYVWTRQAGGEWQPEMVITKLRRAGLCVSVAPGGLKFGIGSSEKVVDVVYLDAGRELWAPRLIKKKHSSSVMAVAWHPCSALLASAGTDSMLRMFNAVVPDVDGRPDLPVLSSSRFGDCLLELPLPGGWGLAVAFSPSGSTLAAASQGSQLTLLTGIDLQNPATLDTAAAAAAAPGRLQHLELPGLPLKCLAFLSEDVLVGGGFDCQPMIFTRQQPGGQWQYVRSLRGMKASSSGAAGGSSKPASMSTRIRMFEQQAAAAAATGSSRGAAAPGGGAGPGNGSSRGLDQQQQQQQEKQNGSGPHENCIIAISPLSSGTPGTLAFLTASLEGVIAEWHLDPSTL